MQRRFFIFAVIAIALFSVVSFAQTTALTQAERDAALSQLQRTHDAFVKSISGLSIKQWTFKPAPDRWSVAEVAEHIQAAPGAKVVDVSGFYVTPGLVDIHVHVYAGTGERRAYAGDHSVYPDGFKIGRAHV